MSSINSFLASVVTQIVDPIILLLAAVALLVFLWGVFQFIRQAGDESKREEGRSAIFWGVIGLVVIFGAYGVINVALNTFGLTPLTAHSIGGSTGF